MLAYMHDIILENWTSFAELRNSQLIKLNDLIRTSSSGRGFILDLIGCCWSLICGRLWLVCGGVITSHGWLIALSFVFWLCLIGLGLWCLILGFLGVRWFFILWAISGPFGDVRSLLGCFILDFLVVALRLVIRIVLNKQMKLLVEELQLTRD